MSLRSDPGRLPRRNHYQEGPGFLFLATQGGRPLEADVAGDVAGVVRLRAAALRRWHEGMPPRRSPRSSASGAPPCIAGRSATRGGG